MGLSPSELLAIGRLEDYNPNRFDPSTNPRGLAGEGYKTNGTQAWNDTAEIGNAIARLAGEADTDATAASASASAAAASAVTAGTARDQAVAAAASSDFPYATTAGTASAYTLDLTPDRVTGSGSACRVRFHIANNATPTLQIDAGSAAEIVDATGRSLAAGEIALNRVYIVVYDGALSKWVIQSLQDPDIVKSDVTATFSAGYNSDIHALGTISSGTVTLASDSASENKKTLTNNGAFTLAAPSTNTNIELIVTNGASAGAITLSGFTHRSGSFDTTNGRVFVCYITTSGSFKEIVIRQAEAV